MVDYSCICNRNYFILFCIFSFFFSSLFFFQSNHLFLSTAFAPNGQQLSGSDKSQSESVVPPLDVPSIENRIKEVQLNISLIKTFMV